MSRNRRCTTAAVAFDPLEYTHQLEASGVPREQAEVHAKAMTAMFLHNFEGLPRFNGYALVTKDYLDSRFNEFELRIEAKIDKRFARMDARFAEMDARFAEMDARFARTNVLLGVILLALAIPVLQTVLVWTAP